MNDREEQDNELLALESIFQEDRRLLLAREGEEPGGMFMAMQSLPQPFFVSASPATCAKMAHAADQASAQEGKLLQIENLTPITLNFVFPIDYPSVRAPHFTLTCEWMSKQQLTILCARLDEIWEENKGSVILFMWFQFLQDEAFDYLQILSPLDLTKVVPPSRHKHIGHSKIDSAGKSTFESSSLQKSNCVGDKASVVCPLLHIDCEHSEHSVQNCISHLELEATDPRAVQDIVSVPQLLKILIKYDKDKQKEVFLSSTVLCSICFSSKLGRYCMRFHDCGHAFCRDCLREYFKVQIQDGNVKELKCPDSQCESQAYPDQVKELVSEKEFERYDQLLLQTTLETMADVVYCPRHSCESPVIVEDGNSKMGQCPSCQFAFCTLCKLSYHGLSPCRIKSQELKKLREDYLNADEETKRFLEKRYGKRAINQALEETFSAEWLEKNAKMCPYCSTQIQKTEGCNKMTCFKCRTYFCWLCSEVLSRSNPYSHFNAPGSKCYARLFEGVEIDDDDEFDEEDDEDLIFDDDW